MKVFFVRLVLVLVGIELGCALAFNIVSKHINFFDAKSLIASDSAFQGAYSVFDPLLGWKFKRDTKFGERPVPTNFSHDIISVYGDSFAFGDEVQDDEAWSYKLSQLLKGNVLNFGANAYGPDQSFLKFKSEFPNVRTPIVVFVLTTENLNRLLNV